MPLGTMFQLGYLVDALEPAMAHWTQALGAGPFFVLPPREFIELSVDGIVAEDRRMIADVALGQYGDLQIELIVPGPAASTYHRFLDAGRTGLHHFGILTDAFDASRAEALARGYVPETEARTSLTRIAYLRPPAPGSSEIIELVEVNEGTRATFGMIRDVSVGWDGRDPVRAL